MSKVHLPVTPLNARGMREPDEVQSVMLRMGRPFVKHLDTLCKVNQRSRREIVEILIAEASAEYQENPQARIEPL